MFSRYYTIAKIAFSVFLFFIGVQIANAQCNPGDLDTDNDGICNTEDMDDDNDGILDEDEIFNYSIYQYNREDLSHFASNVPYTVTGATTVSGTYDSRNIEGDITYNGVGWDLLAADINPDRSGIITVQIALTSSTNATYVIADAILVTDGINYYIVDNTDTGFSVNGSWIYQGFGYNGDNHYIINSAYNGATVTWSVTNLNSVGNGVEADTDGDSISNSLDLDSDNDGCPDATEGSAEFTIYDIDSSGALNGNVDTNANSPTYGVPLIAGSGQAVSNSQNAGELPDDISCLCATINMPSDTDNDGICDIADICSNFDDTLIGQPCNDNDACTANDVYVDCSCYGTITNDTDNDGTCDALDQCPSFNNEIDIDNDGIPYCMDNCVDVDEDNICDDMDNAVIVDDLKIRFSHERGFYQDTFSLSILSNDPNAIIKYSTSQSIIPSVIAGSIYQRPIKITIPNDGIFVVKAFTYNSYDTTKVKTHSYVFLNQVHKHNATFENINNDPQYGPILRQGFIDLPSVSIFVDNNQAINGSSDSKISIEWLYPQNLEEGPNHQVDAGIRYSSGGVNGASPKQSLKIYFRKEHGYAKLEYPLFEKYEYGIEPTETFDRIYLRNGSHDSTIPGNYNNYKAGVYVRQRFSQDSQLEMGNIAPHGRFVNVFVNGSYYGMFHMHERPTRGFMEEYVGGEGDQYDAIRQGAPSSGTINQYNEMVSNANNYTILKNYMNEQSFIDYIQIMFHSATHDYATNKNWRASGPSELDTPLGAKWHFFCWDMDTGLGWYREPAVSSVPTNNVSVGVSPGNMYASLKNDVEFKFDFADRLHCNFYDDGPLTKENMTTRFNKRTNEIKNAVLAESLRWTDLNTYTDKWHYNVDLTREFIELREDYLLSVLTADNMYPDLSAVSFSKAEGEMNINENLTLTNSNSTGTIYYTTNGEDPRLVDGSINPNALMYNNALSFNSSVIEIFARVYDPSQINDIDKWSAACPKTYYVGQNYEDIIINEIHYNPIDSIYYNASLAVNDTVDGKSFEFVELKNIGSEPVNLLNCSFSKGIQLEFEEHLIIEPDSFLVFAEHEFWFEQKYGFAPDAAFIGKLDNGGEKINLKNPFGSFIDTLRYDDEGVWDATPDEGEYSLAYIVNATDNNNPTNWAAQKVFVTPRAENDFCSPITNNSIIADISCYGANDGFITTQINGGTPPFSYNWNNGATTTTITNLSTGNYSLTITDLYNCTYVEMFNVSEPAELTASITTTNETYYKASDGMATININGGVTPYNYNWSNGSTNTTVNNLAPGNYTINVTDAIGCNLNQTVAIDSLRCNTIEVMVSSQDESCPGENDGLLQITNIQNGTTPYSILWSTGITGTVTNNLTAGNYQLDITDANGCPFKDDYTINAATNITATTNITNVSSSLNNDGAIDLTISGGAPPYNYYWSNGTTLQDLNNVAAGSYWISITDANDCQLYLNNLEVDNNCPLTIIQQNQPTLTSEVYQVVNFIQSNGSVSANENVLFKAGNYIELTYDFEVTSGAELEVLIEGCQ